MMLNCDPIFLYLYTYEKYITAVLTWIFYLYYNKNSLRYCHKSTLSILEKIHVNKGSALVIGDQPKTYIIFILILQKNIPSLTSILSIWCKFHQHFRHNFCANIFAPKNYKAKTLLEKSCARHFCTEKLHIKCWWNWLMLVAGLLIKKFWKKSGDKYFFRWKIFKDCQN